MHRFPFLFALASAPLASAQFLEPDAQLLWARHGESAGQEFGYVANPVGDLNGDGASEILTSAPYNATGGPSAGKAYLLDGATGATLREHVGTTPNGFLGFRLEPVGDIDGDGTPDYGVGASGNQFTSESGEAFIYSGDLSLDASAWTLHHEVHRAANDRFGHAIAGIADIDGDGCGEYLIGAPYHDAAGPNTGRLYVLSGADGSLIRAHDGALPEQNLGRSAANVGDIDADGFDDYATGCPGLVRTFPPPAVDTPGRVLVFSGKTGDQLLEIEELSPTAAAFGRYFVSTPGDVTGDGVNDIFTSDFWDTHAGPRTGAAYVFSGADGSLVHEILGEDQQDWVGFGGRAIGDVDCDGHADFVSNNTFNADTPSVWGGRVIVHSGVDASPLRTITSTTPGVPGDPNRAGEWLGYDCTGVPDTNGDGIPEILATAGFNFELGTRTGAVYMFAGVDLRCVGDVNSDGAVDVFDFSDLAAAFGASVRPCASADVNGDSIVDVFDFAEIAGNFGATCP